MMQSSAGCELETEYVYVLQLEMDKLYVGKSKDVHERLCEHRKGATAWTAKYKPVPGDVAIFYEEVMHHKTDEDAMTERVMSDFGIENVRGGTYSQVILSPWLLKTLEDKKCTWGDLCFVCKKKGHTSRICPDRLGHRGILRRVRVATSIVSGVEELTERVGNMRVKPTCGDSGGKTQLGEPCRGMQIGKECKRCYWHCNDAKCKLPKHIATRNKRGLT